MNMTKQIFVSFILLGILTGPLHVEAGGRVSLLKPRKSGTISRAEILRKRPNWILSEQISRRLSKRTRETYQQAKLAQQERAHSRGLTIGEPVRAVRRAKDMPTAENEVIRLAGVLVGGNAEFENITPDENKYLKRLYKANGGKVTIPLTGSPIYIYGVN